MISFNLIDEFVFFSYCRACACYLHVSLRPPHLCTQDVGFERTKLIGVSLVGIDLEDARCEYSTWP